ncbi:SRPBCC domain-containing protein [Rhizobium gallicum]|uniref:SRPBCC domain-containing protein n=1 Tax=Rhizobium gallicum TaxID=56730 RepID=UPI001EF887D4|nr:SRPBCC domain-containing protein [Rhizobium gallicum]ULJ76083.1 SRPBCC domain-containing protein [Rhizobium gallicum]
MYEVIKWPEDMTPSRSPIHFTNELEVAASPETIWSLLVDHTAWPSFYPGVKYVELLGGHESLRLGTRFETNLAGQDVYASVQEFEPMTRIAWGGGPKSSLESKAYHAWIITPTPNGTHLWTEETMQGPLWIELAKEAPDIFWRTHEKLLQDLAKVATQRVSLPRDKARADDVRAST